MTTQHPTNKETLKSFQDLEKEALKEISLEIIKTDLLKSLKDQHTKLIIDFNHQMAGFETRCRQQIEQDLEHRLREQLQKHFQGVVVSCQTQVSEIISPLIKRAEADIEGLNKTIRQTNELCHDIQKKYAFRWESPFFSLILGTSLAGAIFGLIIFFLQVPFVSILLMNEHTRTAYERGASLMAYQKELEAKYGSEEVKVQEAPKASKKKKK